jgi:hypothetical protein
MKKGDNLVRVFTGSEVSAILLKGELESIGISALIQNDYQAGNSVGFMGGTPSAIDLFIQESDLKEAEAIVNEFIQNNIQ